MKPSLDQSIGFMQGRLTPPLRGRIQCFPELHWKQELRLAASNHFPLMEWTLDRETWDANPLVTKLGRKEIATLLMETGVRVPSLTCDQFMEKPFFKASDRERQLLIEELRLVIEAGAELGISILVIPLVDNARVENSLQEDILLEGLCGLVPLMDSLGIRIAFESDRHPRALSRFLSELPTSHFGVNYDIGNSASLGFDPVEEITTYGQAIINVHVKDRLLGGTTVALGTGNANFPVVFEQLRKIGYSGNYVLQTARATNGTDLETAIQYREMVAEWLKVGGNNPWNSVSPEKEL